MTFSTRPVKIPYHGTNLLEMSLLNKGTGFTEQERHDLKLHGLVPTVFETIEEQEVRIAAQYALLKEDLERCRIKTLISRKETLSSARTIRTQRCCACRLCTAVCAVSRGIARARPLPTRRACGGCGRIRAAPPAARPRPGDVTGGTS